MHLKHMTGAMSWSHYHTWNMPQLCLKEAREGVVKDVFGWELLCFSKYTVDASAKTAALLNKVNDMTESGDLADILRPEVAAQSSAKSSDSVGGWPAQNRPYSQEDRWRMFQKPSYNGWMVLSSLYRALQIWSAVEM